MLSKVVGKASSDRCADTNNPIFAEAEARRGGPLPRGAGCRAWPDPRDDCQIP